MPLRSNDPLRTKHRTHSRAARIGSRLPRTFYERSSLIVAHELVGKILRYQAPTGDWALRIVEVEAYLGERDEASHAFRGKTARNAVMYGEGGHAYVYFIYGMYHCVNVVTRKTGIAGAVLIRAGEILEVPAGDGERGEIMDARAASGPGKLCRLLGLTREHNGLDLTDGPLTIHSSNLKPGRIVRTPRIGIRLAADKLWRFIDNDSRAVSGKRH